MTGDADCSISFKRCFCGFCYRKQVRLGEVGLGGLFETTVNVEYSGEDPFSFLATTFPRVISSMS